MLKIGIYGKGGQEVPSAIAAGVGALGHRPIWRNPGPYGRGQIEKFDVVAVCAGAPNEAAIARDYIGKGIPVINVGPPDASKKHPIYLHQVESDSYGEGSLEDITSGVALSALLGGDQPDPQPSTQPFTDYGPMAEMPVAKLRELAQDKSIPLGRGITAKADILKVLWEAGVRVESDSSDPEGKSGEPA